MTYTVGPDMGLMVGNLDFGLVGDFANASDFEIDESSDAHQAVLSEYLTDNLEAKPKSKSTSTSSSSPFPLSAAAASTSQSSAAVASPSQGPGEEGGGNRSESPETTSILPAAATASSTKKPRTKQGESNTETTNGPAAIDEPQNTTHVPTDLGDDDNPSKKAGVKTMWVTIFKCFTCGKRGHDLTKCARCEEAYYCDRDCQIAHARAHAKVCVATVAAKAQRAHRERIARALRKNDKGKMGGGEVEDDLCVICQSKPVNEVEVSQSCVCWC